MSTLADVYRATMANQEFMMTLKTYLEKVTREEGMSQINVNNPLQVKTQKNKTEYKAGQNISVTIDEAEIDLGGTYNEITILNSGAASIFVRLNTNTNDQIELTPTGTADSSMSMDFEISKIYHKTASGTSTLRYVATR